MARSNSARNQFVAKRNDIIQQSRLSLTLTQSKAISYILSKVKREDTEDTHYFFNIGEFKHIMKLKKITYKEVGDMLQNIADQSTYIVDKTGKLKLIRWLDIVRIEPVDGKIELTLHKDITPYVFNLIEQKDENGEYYTTYKLQDISLMKHYYSPRVYEILKSYAYNNEQWKFEFNTGSDKDLQVLIAKPDEKGNPVIPKSWSSWAVFKRDVLEPAKDEINKYTPIKIAYKESKYDLYGTKQGRICTIEFYMLEKTKGEKNQTEDIIEQEYKEVDEEEERQMSIFDNFYNAHREQLEKEALEELAEMDDELEKRQEKSICPVFLENFSEFSDEEVEGLFKAALDHIARGIFSIKKRNWDARELWAIDYVTYYYDKIKATAKDTKTTVFKRLYDCVSKDYDDYSVKVNMDYIDRYGDR
ncbi:MAG: replication initiation protein [Lachnospiraceae bacterium]|nr:replication initiation protein [Lachnospiraceae bacterium]